MLPVTRLDQAYSNQIQRVRSRILSYTERRWDRLGSYREADYELLVADLIPKVEMGQQRIADLTDAYIRKVSELDLGQSPTTAANLAASTLELRGVDAETVYRRPFTTVYTKISEGQTLAVAASAGTARLASITSTGLQLAKTHSARHVTGKSKFSMYRRVLTGRENCGLCVIASTQRYKVANLMPIHPGCDCNVRPYDGPDDQILDPDLLEATHAAVEQQFGDSDRNARFVDGLNERGDYLDLIISNEHSEIGPVLGWRSQHFSGAEVLA